MKKLMALILTLVFALSAGTAALADRPMRPLISPNPATGAEAPAETAAALAVSALIAGAAVSLKK